jgi:hypothetical protein
MISDNNEIALREVARETRDQSSANGVFPYPNLPNHRQNFGGTAILSGI